MGATDHDTGGTEVLYEHAPCGLLVTDDDGLLLRANDTFCGWVGVEGGALVGRRRFQDLLTVGGRIFHQTQWMPLLRMQGSVTEIKLDVTREGAGPLPMVMNAIRRERDGAVVHEIALFIATDRHAYERELLAARKRAEELATQQRAAREFAEQMMAIVSHDLRTPLGTIRTGGEVLRMLDLPERYRPLLGNIDRATDRALALINDLLDLTRSRLGQGMAITRQPIDLHDTVAAQVAELSQAYPEARIEHFRQGDGHCEADPVRLGQLVGNLVSNAVAYGRPGAPVVVSTSIDAECTISVHNEGEPIPEALQGSLFQPMVRGTVVGAATRSVGLGLYIVDEVARAHGGAARLAPATRGRGHRRDVHQVRRISLGKWGCVRLECHPVGYRPSRM
ncbi:MAG: HAMP domain-containing histidine kinase [Proteobacteria bacterium]|nr:HAMP domain-containing histidine kinase [Pseudomonadota bacterium]